jgi:hypothetical protein
MRDEKTRRSRFEEKLRRLLERKTRRLQGTGEILRSEVEVIGASLGMSEEDACESFLGLRGSLWDLHTNNVFDSTISSAKGEAAPRNWFAFTDVYLIKPH